MKQYQIIQAYNAMETLADNNNLTKEDQWKIFILRKSLRSHVEFQQEQEKALTEKYTPFADEQGILRGEKYTEYLNEKEELQNMEVECSFEKIKLQLKDGITFKTIESLENFIEFYIE